MFFRRINVLSAVLALVSGVALRAQETVSIATADNIARQDSKNAQWVAGEARKAIAKAPVPQPAKKKTAKKKAATLKK